MQQHSPALQPLNYIPKMHPSALNFSTLWDVFFLGGGACWIILGLIYRLVNRLAAKWWIGRLVWTSARASACRANYYSAINYSHRPRQRWRPRLVAKYHSIRVKTGFGNVTLNNQSNLYIRTFASLLKSCYSVLRERNMFGCLCSRRCNRAKPVAYLCWLGQLFTLLTFLCNTNWFIWNLNIWCGSFKLLDFSVRLKCKLIAWKAVPLVIFYWSCLRIPLR